MWGVAPFQPLQLCLTGRKGIGASNKERNPMDPCRPSSIMCPPPPPTHTHEQRNAMGHLALWHTQAWQVQAVFAFTIFRKHCEAHDLL